jgi:hypothetical protein
MGKAKENPSGASKPYPKPWPLYKKVALEDNSNTYCELEEGAVHALVALKQPTVNLEVSQEAKNEEEVQVFAPRETSKLSDILIGSEDEETCSEEEVDELADDSAMAIGKEGKKI